MLPYMLAMLPMDVTYGSYLWILPLVKPRSCIFLASFRVSACRRDSAPAADFESQVNQFIPIMLKQLIRGTSGPR